MPYSPLSGHLNLHLLKQNPAEFRTILSSPHKHVAYHNTIPNTATHINQHTFTQAYTPTEATLKSVKIRSFSGPYFPVFGPDMEIYSVNLRIQSKCRKIQAKKYSVFGQFLCSVFFSRPPIPTYHSKLACMHRIPSLNSFHVIIADRKTLTIPVRLLNIFFSFLFSPFFFWWGTGGGGV